MRSMILLCLCLTANLSYGQYNITKTEYNEIKIREYLDTTNVDLIEGIYKYVGDNSEYRFGIVKSSYLYLVILLESNQVKWKTGDVKAYLEPSATENVYSLRWIMGDKKTKQETVAFMKTPGLLEFNIMKTPGLPLEFKYLEFNISVSRFLLKLYPKLDPSINEESKGNSLVSSGSGFFISKDGYIATNAHVVKDGVVYEVTVNNDSHISINYKAKAILIDEVNDVAILKIEDENFIELNQIPYTIETSTKIGEEVFTIGYPLSSVMGNNFKVSKGIINANTGIKDDVRFLQISTPIQAGNSGGPLFNKNGNVVGLTTSKLNEDAIGQTVENVNYAIKANYLVTLSNMLPNLNLNNQIPLITEQQIDLEEQVKNLKNYVCLIRVFQ